MNRLKNYIQGMIEEMKIVTWPGKTVVWDSTKIVLGLSLVLVIFIFASDQLLNWMMTMFITM
jgi:preprotein translocase SecE subunit